MNSKTHRPCGGKTGDWIQLQWSTSALSGKNAAMMQQSEALNRNYLWVVVFDHLKNCTAFGIIYGCARVNLVSSVAWPKQISITRSGWAALVAARRTWKMASSSKENTDLVCRQITLWVENLRKDFNHWVAIYRNFFGAKYAVTDIFHVCGRLNVYFGYWKMHISVLQAWSGNTHTDNGNH